MTDEKRRELVHHMLEALEIPSHPLTKWEENFVESVRDQFNVRGDLSDRQIEVLERIYAEKTA